MTLITRLTDELRKELSSMISAGIEDFERRQESRFQSQLEEIKAMVAALRVQLTVSQPGTLARPPVMSEPTPGTGGNHNQGMGNPNRSKLGKEAETLEFQFLELTAGSSLIQPPVGQSIDLPPLDTATGLSMVNLSQQSPTATVEPNCSQDFPPLVMSFNSIIPTRESRTCGEEQKCIFKELVPAINDDFYFCEQIQSQQHQISPDFEESTSPGQIPGANPAISGMFPNMFPLGTGQFGAVPVMHVQAMTQQATRHARRVYVGGLPPTANEQSVATLFSHVMAAIGGNTAGPGDAVVNVYINHEKKFAFVEMRSIEEASNAMALDGIIFEGTPVKVRRPSDYNPSLAATHGPSHPNPNLNLAAVGLTPGSAGGLEGPDRIFVGGLPYYFTEVQIRELLESFGPLRGFDLVKDRETGNSKGYAFCVYHDLSITDIACAALNGIKMGDKTLTVRRANQGANQPKPEQENVLMHAQQQIALLRLMLQHQPLPTKVVCLTQVVTADELKDDEEYEDILEDMRTEGGKFGTLVNVVIPRPKPDGEPAPGVGKVFLEYADTEGASKARVGMNGRKFGGNQVVAVYFPENKFSQGEYDG